MIRIDTLVKRVDLFRMRLLTKYIYLTHSLPTLLESGDSFPLNSTHLPILTYLKREEVIVVVAVVVVVVVVEEEEEA